MNEDKKAWETLLFNLSAACNRKIGSQAAMEIVASVTKYQLNTNTSEIFKLQSELAYEKGMKRKMFEWLNELQ